MFWLGMAVFIILAVLPIIGATTLNAKDRAKLVDGESQVPSAGQEL